MNVWERFWGIQGLGDQGNKRNKWIEKDTDWIAEDWDTKEAEEDEWDWG